MFCNFCNCFRNCCPWNNCCSRMGCGRCMDRCEERCEERREPALISSVLMQLGDTLATIAAREALCDPRDPD